MSQKHEISCWKCHEMTSLETRNEFDGCCWACGEEIDLDDYLIKAMDKRDEHYAALSAVTAERDRLREEMAELWKRIDKFQSQSHGITALAEIERLRAEVEALRKDAERLDWLDGYIVSADSEDTGEIAFSSSRGALRECVDAAMAAKEA